MTNKSNIRTPVLLIVLNTLRKKDKKSSASLAFYLFSSTGLTNSIKHEHPC